MKKIVICLIMLFTLLVSPYCYADEVNLDYLFELAKSKNIDVNEVLNQPYIGTSYSQIKNGRKPYLIVFADFSDFATAARYVNNGYFVYNNLQKDYGFSVLSYKHPDNSSLVKKLKIRTLPYVVIVNPSHDEILPIKPALYENPQKLVSLLKVYLRKSN